MEKKSYLCPNCRSYLNIDNYIVFSVFTQKRQMGLLMLHPQPGNYKILHHEDLDISPGDKVEFFCPVCHEKLTYAKNENLVNIIMKEDSSNEEVEIFFSSISGERSTYILKDGTLETFGEHKSNYLDFFNLSLLK